MENKFGKTLALNKKNKSPENKPKEKIQGVKIRKKGGKTNVQESKMMKRCPLLAAVNDNKVFFFGQKPTFKTPLNPLKVGIYSEIKQKLEEKGVQFKSRDLACQLNLYTSSRLYLKSLVYSKHRVNLAGERFERDENDFEDGLARYRAYCAKHYPDSPPYEKKELKEFVPPKKDKKFKKPFNKDGKKPFNKGFKRNKPFVKDGQTQNTK